MVQCVEKIATLRRLKDDATSFFSVASINSKGPSLRGFFFA